MRFSDFFNEDKTLKWDVIEKLEIFQTLKGVQQHKDWHMEGDVWEHTVRTVDAMCQILEEEHIPKEHLWYDICVLAALCHDLGKAETTKEKDGNWVAPNHARHSERLTRNLFFDNTIQMREMLCEIIRRHMIFHHIVEKEGDELDTELLKLANGSKAGLYLLWMMKKADDMGSVNKNNAEVDPKNWKKLHDHLEQLGLIVETLSLPRTIPDYSFVGNIMIGLPGSGKSTYLQKLGITDDRIISRDKIRLELGVVFDEKLEDKVTEIFDERMEKFLSEKKTFYIDNTNVRKQFRDGYTRRIREAGGFVRMWYIEPPTIATCLERRQGEPWPSVINRMWKNFDFPDATEYDELNIFKQHGTHSSFYTF